MDSGQISNYRILGSFIIILSDPDLMSWMRQRQRGSVEGGALPTSKKWRKDKQMFWHPPQGKRGYSSIVPSGKGQAELESEQRSLRMVDLTDGASSGLLEHGFNNYVFVLAGIFVFSIVGQYKSLILLFISKEGNEEIRLMYPNPVYEVSWC